ncbi:hypothetical protein JDS97_27100 [Bacillus cereus group sp. N18]|uniref:hypothetical protein n=1 Tax=Bacillus cereus group sp. N18 TaxID=2794590 RepID=UPI000871F20F|nr:hypothetical protein [Bacillus cereus group sp. N18]OFC94772.1 hypothetical protein BTGOE5_51810 [Bacillus thuringiensis]HDR7323833.1 hypothetical protein [Bacillus toyonensis]MBJ8049903.1 hypothetical protein [Bacillus cereus group sp. N18]OFD02578.1 hypothetical protein BTGOE7_52300 [Bacillus thuringiensis]HDR7440891.1 hypothetical protein [Bacillus toyonensis]
MKSRGRKPKIYPKDILLKIIDDFLRNQENVQIIRYKEIFLYALEEYNKGILDFKLSEDFWRKPGRQGKLLVDEINKKRSALIENNNQYIEIISTNDVINRLSQDTPATKKKIINQLKVNEYGYRKISTRYNQLKEKEAKMTQEIVELKAEIMNLKDNNEIYQNVLFQWANLSSVKDLDLINLITTGKTRSATVEQLFKDIFKEQPNKAILELNTDNKIDNVVTITRTKNTLIEDLDL